MTTEPIESAWARLLSKRELEVALLVAQGLSNKEVARKLGLKESTVKGQLYHVFQKLGIKGRYSLILQAQTSKNAAENL